MIFDYVIGNTSDWYVSFWNEQIRYENWLHMHAEAEECVRQQRLKLEELQAKTLTLKAGSVIKVLTRKSDPRWSAARWKSKT